MDQHSLPAALWKALWCLYVLGASRAMIQVKAPSS